MATLTPFQLAQQQAEAGTLKVPTVGTAGKTIPYFGYQLAVHVYNLSLMAKGLHFRNIKFTEIKKYYGLKGKSAADCIQQLKDIQEKYKAGSQN